MNKTNIKWTDFTWNPITGCTAISDGCKNCYAKAVHERFYDYPFSEILLHTDRLEEPLNKKKACKIFVGSMTDLFQDDVSFEYLDEIFHIMMRTPWLTFQILTKRPERMKEYLLSLRDDEWHYATYKSRISLTKLSPPLSFTEIGGVRKWEKTQEWVGRDFDDDAYKFIFEKFPNIWFGVTAENQKEADSRIPLLLEMPVSKRFVSIEPMIEKIDLMNIKQYNSDNKHIASYQVLKSVYGEKKQLIRPSLDWVIVGGESGAKSKVRKMNPDWVQNIYNDCKENNTPFFFKQWGAFTPKEKYSFESIMENI